MSGRPLAGRRVVVTRAAAQAGELAAAFEEAGAEVVLLPLLEVVPPDDPAPLERAAAEAGSYDLWAFTSANAVDAFLARVAIDPAAAGRPKVAVVGPATADSLRSFGLEPDVVAGTARASGLVETLQRTLRGGERILVPQADDARPDVVDGLAALGAEVTAVVAYAKRLPPASAELARRLFAGSPLGRVTFTSPRVVRHFAELLGEGWSARRRELLAISIGPVTSAELRRRGVEAIAEASSPTPAEMVRATVRSDPRLC